MPGQLDGVVLPPSASSITSVVRGRGNTEPPDKQLPRLDSWFTQKEAA